MSDERRGTLCALVTAATALWLSCASAFSQDGWRRDSEVRVRRVESQYAVAPAAPRGRFATGQDADLMLSGVDFNNTGGPLLFHHPSGLASDGRRLLLCDRFNNRVLVWTTLPTKNTPPDLVLGQPDFSANNPGAGRHQLNWPGNVALTPDGAKVVVADTNNDRVLLWNSFPDQNAAPAQVVIELARFGRGGRQRLAWPWGVWTDGKKLAVVATHGSSVLMWNTLPTRDHQPPDLVLTPRDTGTPRNVTSDGAFFALSDNNYGPDSRPATMVWRTFPTAATQPPDFVWREWLKGMFTSDRKLILAGPRTIYLWNTLPPDAQTDADVVLRPPSYANGDGPDVVLAGGRLYVCNYNGNNVLVWNSLPTRDHQPPDFALGSDRPEVNTLAENFFIQNPSVATDGQSLFVSSDFDHKLSVWRRLPNASGAKPDVVYSLPDAPWDNALHGQTLVLAGKRTVFVWRKAPLNGELPDLTFTDRIGRVRFGQLTGVALDDRHLYLADRQADKIYVWDGIPGRDAEPKFTLGAQQPGRMSSDGQYLAVAPFAGPTITVYRVAELGARPTPVRLGGPGRFNLPGKCLVAHGHLFVADSGFNRLHVWHRIADALAGRPADALLGAREDADRNPETGRDKLFMPATLAFDGGYLWVGEFKFSSRVLRFSPSARAEPSER